MADIELVIKIPEEAKQAFDCAESNDLKGCYYDHGGVIGKAIANGIPLPKGHGRLIDADELLKKSYRIDDSETLSTRDVVNVEDVDDAQTIIEADKAESDE